MIYSVNQPVLSLSFIFMLELFSLHLLQQKGYKSWTLKQGSIFLQRQVRVEGDGKDSKHVSSYHFFKSPSHAVGMNQNTMVLDCRAQLKLRRMRTSSTLRNCGLFLNPSSFPISPFPWISQTFPLLAFNGWWLRLESRSHHSLSAGQLSLHVVTHLFQFLFQGKDAYIVLPCLKPSIFWCLWMMSRCVAYIWSSVVRCPLLSAIFPHDVLPSSHVNFISVYGLPWSCLPLGLPMSCCLWW